MKIAMLVDWFFPYAAGIANALAGQADVLVVTRDHGHELGIEGDARHAKRALLDERVALTIVPGRLRDVGSLTDVVQTHRLLRQFDPSVLHVQYHVDWRLYGLQRSMWEVPALLTIHDVVDHLSNEKAATFRSNPTSFIGDRLRSRAGAYVVHGRRLATLLQRQTWYNGTDIDVIPHGTFPYGMSCPPLPELPSILFFGRLEYYKGLDLLVQAAETAAHAVPGLRVIVAGRGNDATRCRRLVMSPGLFDWREDYVAFDRLAALMSEASVVVLPYRDASQSGVIPLAFQFGRTVLATHVGALAETVDDGVNGLLVEEASTEALAAAIVRLFSDPDLLTRLTAGATATVTSGKLSPRHVSALHLEACERLLAVRGRRR